MTAPEGFEKPSLELLLIEPERGEVIESRPVEAGKVDLAKIFPRLWETAEPRVLYVQAAAAGERYGPAAVLAPMLTPRYAPRADRDGVPAFGPAASGKQRSFAGYWLYTDKDAVVQTNVGEMRFRLRMDVAPRSAAHFRELVDKGFYSDIPVHRVASLIGQPRPDIVQFGDPTGTGQGGPGYFVDLEPSSLRHDYGVLSLARTSDPNSGGSQVIVCLSREGTSYLDGRYASFGQMIAGSDALRAISKTPVNAEGKPKDPPVVKSVKLVDAAPMGTGPEPLKDPLKQVPAR